MGQLTVDLSAKMELLKTKEQRASLAGVAFPRYFTARLEPGKTLVVKLLTVSDAHPDGTRTIFFELNGQPREVNIRDNALRATVQARPKAEVQLMDGEEAI